MFTGCGRYKEKLYCPSCVPTENESVNTNMNNTCIFEKLNDFLGNKGLKIFHQNVNGLVSKIEKLRSVLQETNINIQYTVLRNHICIKTFKTLKLLLVVIVSSGKIVRKVLAVGWGATFERILTGKGDQI